jgi:hypothetical protein
MAKRHSGQRSDAPSEISRRCFLQAGLASTGTIFAESILQTSIIAAQVRLQMTNTGSDQVPRKPLGKTGE